PLFIRYRADEPAWLTRGTVVVARTAHRLEKGEVQSGRSLGWTRRGGPVGVVAALSTAWGPDLLGGGVRGGERAGDCLRPLIGASQQADLAYLGSTRPRPQTG